MSQLSQEHLKAKYWSGGVMLQPKIPHAVDWGEDGLPKPRRKCCKEGDPTPQWDIPCCYHLHYKFFEIRDAYGVVVNKFAACDKCQKIGKPRDVPKTILQVHLD